MNNENFDEKFDEKIIENEKNKINKIFDCDANFELLNIKIIDSKNVKENVKFEIANFDFLI